MAGGGEAKWEAAVYEDAASKYGTGAHLGHWIKSFEGCIPTSNGPKKFAGCAQRFKGNHEPGQCVHGVGGDLAHYTCCGKTDQSSECNVVHLPLGVKLIRGFLSPTQQQGLVEHMLREQMVLRHQTLNFVGPYVSALTVGPYVGALTAPPLSEIKNSAQVWARRLTHGNDIPFTFGHGHFYNDTRRAGANTFQSAHRDAGAIHDRTFGVSVGASMWFHYSQRQSQERQASMADLEHHVLVRSGDAMLFDGMSLTHAASDMQLDSVPDWWADAVQTAGTGHLENYHDDDGHAGHICGYAEADPRIRYYGNKADAEAAMRDNYPDAAGITREQDGRFTIRSGSFVPSQSNGERSWPDPLREPLATYAPCRMFFGLR